MEPFLIILGAAFGIGCDRYFRNRDFVYWRNITGHCMYCKQRMEEPK